MDIRTFEGKLQAFWNEFRKECPDSDKLYRYLSGDLDPGERAKIEEHLSMCAVCEVKKKDVLEALDIISEPVEEGKWAVQTGLVERFFDLATSSREKLNSFFAKGFTFPQPIKLLALRPMSEAMAFAEAGRQFEKESESADQVPYEVELSVFGNRLALTVKSRSSLYDHSVVRFELVEGEQVRFSGVVLVGDGQGKYETEVDRIPKPEREEFKVGLQPIHSLDLLSKVEEDASLEVLSELLKEAEPRIRKACVELLAGVRTMKVRQILKQLEDDPDPEIRQAVRELLRGDRPEHA